MNWIGCRAVCSSGAHRLFPSWGMTFVFNLMFYVVVVAIILFTTLSLSPKVMSAAPGAPAVFARR